MSEDPWENEPDEWASRRKSAPGAKQGMSSGTKVLIGCLAVTGVGLLVCCGGFGYFAYQFSQKVVTEPEEIRDITESILTIDLPEEYQPQVGMDLDSVPFVPDVKWVQYMDKNTNAQLMLVMMDEGTNGNSEEQLEQALEQQGESNPKIENTEELEVREYEIRGQKVKIHFLRGTDQESRKAYRQVTGSFLDGGDRIMIMMQIPEEHYDNEKVTKILESIE